MAPPPASPFKLPKSGGEIAPSILLSKKTDGTLEAPRGVRQMIGVPQSSADRCATAWVSRKSKLFYGFTVNCPPCPPSLTPLGIRGGGAINLPSLPDSETMSVQSVACSIKWPLITPPPLDFKLSAISGPVGSLALVSRAKGQIISECALEILDFPKIPRKIWQISALES